MNSRAWTSCFEFSWGGAGSGAEDKNKKGRTLKFLGQGIDVVVVLLQCKKSKRGRKVGI